MSGDELRRKQYLSTALICLSAFLFLSPSDALGQGSVVVEAGWNQGLQTNLVGSIDGGVETLKFTQQPVWAFSFRFGGMERSHRWGFSFSTHQVAVIKSRIDWSSKVRVTSLQLLYERKLLAARRFRVALDLGGGLGWFHRSDLRGLSDNCDTAFCGLPQFTWILSPGLRLFVPVHGMIGLTAAARWDAYTVAASESVPFDSGFVFLVGIELYIDNSPEEREP